MNTNFPYKQIVFYIAESGGSYRWVDTIGDTDEGYLCSDGTYEFPYRNLDPETQYDVKIVIYMLVFPGGSSPFMEEATLYSDFETEGGGGGGWTLFERSLGNLSSETSRFENGLDADTLYRYSMSFTNAGSVTFSSSGNADTRAWLSTYSQTGWDDVNGVPDDFVAEDDDSGSDHNFEITYTCDANTTYYLWFRTYSGGEYANAVGITITPSGGGGNWQLYEERAGTVSSSFDYTYNNGLSGMTLYRMSITFAQNATVTFSTSGNGDTKGWLSDYNQTSWDDTTGEPNNYVAYDDDSGSGSNFQFSYSCTAERVYYLWYRAYSDSGYSGQVTLSVSFDSGTSWSYEAVAGYSDLSSETMKSVTISAATGQYFGVSFANSGTATIRVPSGANLDLFVTDANYGYDTADGFPYTYSGKATSSLTQNVSVTSGTTYYVWVKGSTPSITGGINVTITPPSVAHTWTYTLAASITDPSSTVTRSYTLTAGNGYYMAVRFQYAGTAVFYTEGSGDDKGFLTSSDSGYNYDTGVPNAVIASDDDHGTGSNFQITYSVDANTTYYLWLRMYDASSSGSVTLYVDPPAAPSVGGYVWVFTGSGWQKAKPYVFTGSGWQVAIPYIFDGSTWKTTI